MYIYKHTHILTHGYGHIYVCLCVKIDIIKLFFPYKIFSICYFCNSKYDNVTLVYFFNLNAAR